MLPAIYSTITALDAASTYLDVTSNNIANANTVGYKTSQITFQDLFYQTRLPPGALNAEGLPIPAGIQVGLGVAVDALTGLFTQGTITPTGVPLDVAISGPGFFQLSLPDGTTAYTRDGTFRIDAAGQLVDESGFIVTPPITFPPETSSFVIAADGTVTATTPAGPQVIGQIQLARFVNPGGLLRIGNTLFTESPASGPPTVGAPGTNGLGTLQQGFVEQSNVELVTELVNLIIAQQTFTVNTQALGIENDVLAVTADLIP
jgi:flagellar basal-body rod protein FlgG